MDWSKNKKDYIIHFAMSSLTSLNFVMWLNILFPMIPYMWLKIFTTCGINSVLYSSISLFNSGNTYLYSNCFLYLYIGSIKSYSLFRSINRDFGREYWIPWQRCGKINGISIYESSSFVHFSPISFTSIFWLLRQLNRLLVRTLRLFSISGRIILFNSTKIYIAFNVTLWLGSFICLLRMSIKWQLDRNWTNSWGNWSASFFIFLVA